MYGGGKLSELTHDSQLLAVIPKNSTTRLQASISRFKGKDRFDLRMYYRGDCAEWLPTQKGIAIDMEQVPLLIEALQKVLALASQVEESAT
jgi:hypothetical protein